MKLTIVIPALDEEDSIEQIITRSLSARDEIIKNSDVTEVTVTVVSDGSTDRTVEIAQQYTDQIHLIVFEKNKGYGAAIKQGWLESDADLLSFLDADGTCDPLFFVELCNLVTREGADVALGSRLNKNSKMPFTRRLGNTMFSLLLRFVSSQKVKDTASGMRVVKRSCLPQLMPLPDGLHFTPAMSARSLLSDDIIIKEKDMTYEERAGESKLNIWKDGVRFLNVIMKTTFLYKPNRLLSWAGFLCMLMAMLIIFMPVKHYIEEGTVQDWMIYRFQVANLLGILTFLFFSASFVAEKIVRITVLKNFNQLNRMTIWSRFYNSKWIWLLIVACAVFGFILVGESFIERLKSGQTDEHWSRYIVATFFLCVAFIAAVTKMISGVLNLVLTRVSYLQSGEYSKYK